MDIRTPSSFMVKDTLTSHIDIYRRFLTGLACCAVLVLLLRDSLFLNPFWGGDRRSVEMLGNFNPVEISGEDDARGRVSIPYCITTYSYLSRT